MDETEGDNAKLLLWLQELIKHQICHHFIYVIKALLNISYCKA